MHFRKNLNFLNEHLSQLWQKWDTNLTLLQMITSPGHCYKMLYRHNSTQRSQKKMVITDSDKACNNNVHSFGLLPLLQLCWYQYAYTTQTDPGRVIIETAMNLRFILRRKDTVISYLKHRFTTGNKEVKISLKSSKCMQCETESTFCPLLDIHDIQRIWHQSRNF